MEQNQPLTLGLVQMSMVEDPDTNLAKAEELIRVAARRGSDIICLPELFRSPYFCVQESSARDYAEECPGKVGSSLSRLAAEFSVTIVGGSIYEQAKDKRFNTSLVYGPSGALLGEYRKTHIPHDPAFYEQNYFSSGDSNYRIFSTTVNGREVKIGVLICFDQWFPEAARSLALMGVDIIFYPTAIGTVDSVQQIEGSWQHAWTTVQCGHAVANATVVAAVNRVGKEGDSNFWGGSFVCDAFGRILATGTNREEVITAPIDLSHNRFIKESWRFFKERRPDTYTLLTNKR